MNKHKISIFKFVPAFLLAAMIVTLLGASFSNAQPGATPPGGNVEANFDSIKLPKGPKMTGSHGYFVGVTDATYSGTDVGGYPGALEKCTALVSGSHICSAKEIINSYEYISSPALPISGKAWINNGPPAYVQYVSNDCNGWSTNSSLAFGSIWNFVKKQGFMTPCNQKMAIACCSY